MKKTKNQNGITLIALIIVIIVLMILSGILVGVISGDKGIITQAINAKSETEKKDITEEVNEIWYKFEKDNIDKNYSKSEMVNEFKRQYGINATLENGKTVNINYKGYTVKINI